MNKIIYIVLLGLIVAVVMCIKEPREQKAMTDAEVLADPRAAAEWSERSKNKSKASLYKEAYECLLNKEYD